MGRVAYDARDPEKSVESPGFEMMWMRTSFLARNIDEERYIGMTSATVFNNSVVISYHLN